MPKNEQTILLSGLSKEKSLAICYETYQKLEWTVLYAGEDRLLGMTTGKQGGKGQQITASIDDNGLTVSSEMVNEESFDLMGRNKKNVDRFIANFETLKSVISEEDVNSHLATIELLRIETQRTIEQEQKEAEEVSRAMNLSGSNLYATYTITGINILVFILMAFDGAGIFDANVLVHIKWGSNFSPLTLSGDWWRLLTNIFIHFGIIHLLMNMYCLYTIGVYLEPMLGKYRYVTAYVSAGVLASIASLWWHSGTVNSAGASGAIFGLYGLFLAMLTTDLIPKKVKDQLLKSIGIFVVYNLIYGVKSGIDNAAHIGGLISGIFIGCLYVISIRKQKREEREKWTVPAVAGITVVVAAFFLQYHIQTADRSGIFKEIKYAFYKDTQKFNATYDNFIELQNAALAPINDSNVQLNEALSLTIQSVTLRKWAEALSLTDDMQAYDVADEMKAKVPVIKRYIGLQIEKAKLIQLLIKDNSAANNQKLQTLNEEINKEVQTLQ